MIETERLILRQFRDDDRAPWAAMNADPVVMQHFPAPLSRSEADGLMDRVHRRIAETGIGFWAIERRADGAFLGFGGLNVVHHDIPVKGEWETGWRLARHAWGHGYATEVGNAALAVGFGRLRLKRIVAYTAATNAPSEAVMQRIGMARAAHLDFEHPVVPVGSPVRPHIVYLKQP